MKKIILISILGMAMAMCKPAGPKTSANASTMAETNPAVSYRDDFPSASASEKTAYLKALNASSSKYSVIIFTQGYKGEKIVATNGSKKVYSEYTISDLKSGLANKTRIDNTLDTKVHDNFTKKEVVIPAEKAQKYKFIYLRKDNSNTKNPISITYSNTMRPMEL